MKINKIFIAIALLTAAVTGVYFLHQRQLPHIPSLLFGPSKGKKIVILTSRGGGGQTSVTQALTQELQGKYQIGVTDAFSDLLLPLDFLNTLAGGRASGVDLYNYLVQKKNSWALNNILHPIGHWLYNLQHKKIESLLRTYLIQESPELVISVVPIINNPILNICKEFNIPFLLVSPDLDPTMYISSMETPNYEKFKLLLPFYDQSIASIVQQSNIPKESIGITGYPVKKSFLEQKNKRRIKKEWGVPENVPIIFVLLGAQGTTALPRFAKELSKLTIPVHCIFGTGKSEYLAEKIKILPWPSSTTITIVGFTDKVADLMAIADIMITKSGSVSFAEAIYSDLPMLLDGTETIVKWEQENVKFLSCHHLGGIITSYKQVPNLVTDYLTTPDLLEKTRANIQALDRMNGTLEIKKIIDEYLK